MQLSRLIKIIALLLFVFLMLPHLASEGMFFDGTQYACIARNMSEGTGSFWLPKFSETMYAQFTEHPPLGFFIESLFFRTFGDYLWVEKLFSVFTLGITIFIIILIWKKVQMNLSQSIKFSFLPVLFFLSIPLVAWSYSNNLLENIQGIFTITAVYIYLLLCLGNNLSSGKKYFFRIMISILITAGLLTKGMNTLFVLSVPVIFFILNRKSILKMIVDVIVPSILVILFLAVILVNDEARFSLNRYFHEQFLATLSRETSNENHFYIFLRLFSELVVIIIPLLFLIIWGYFKQIKTEHWLNKWGFFFLLIGLSAILPIMLSPKQHGYYMIPGIPLIALSAACFAYPYISKISDAVEDGRRKKTLKILNAVFSISLLMSTLIVVRYNSGRVGRDKEIIQATKMVAPYIPAGTIISICPEMYKNWALHAYMQRYFKISLSDNSENKYILLNDECNSNLQVNSDYTLVGTEGSYRLYERP